MAADGRSVEDIIAGWEAIAAKVERPAESKKAKKKKGRSLQSLRSFISKSISDPLPKSSSSANVSGISKEKKYTPDEAKELITQQLFDVIVGGTEDLRLVDVYYSILARIDNLEDPTQLRKANLGSALKIFQKNCNHEYFNFFRGIMLRADLSKADPDKAVGILRGDYPISKKLFTISYWPNGTTKETVKKGIAEAFNIAFHDETVRNKSKEVILQRKIIPGSDSRIFDEVRFAFGIKNTIVSMFFPESAAALKKLYGDPVNVEVEKLNIERLRLMNASNELQEEARKKLTDAQKKYAETSAASSKMDSRQKEMWNQCIADEQGTWELIIEEYSEILHSIFPMEVIAEYRKLLFPAETENKYSSIVGKSLDTPLLQVDPEPGSNPISTHNSIIDFSEHTTPIFLESSQNSTDPSFLAMDDSTYRDNSADEEASEATRLIPTQKFLENTNRPPSRLNTPKNSPIDIEAPGFVEIKLDDDKAPTSSTSSIISHLQPSMLAISISNVSLSNLLSAPAVVENILTPIKSLITPKKASKHKHPPQQKHSDEEKLLLLETDEATLRRYEEAQQHKEEEEQKAIERQLEELKQEQERAKERQRLREEAERNPPKEDEKVQAETPGSKEEQRKRKKERDRQRQEELKEIEERERLLELQRRREEEYQREQELKKLKEYEEHRQKILQKQKEKEEEEEIKIRMLINDDAFSKNLRRYMLAKVVVDSSKDTVLELSSSSKDKEKGKKEDESNGIFSLETQEAAKELLSNKSAWVNASIIATLDELPFPSTTYTDPKDHTTVTEKEIHTDPFQYKFVQTKFYNERKILETTITNTSGFADIDVVISGQREAVKKEAASIATMARMICDDNCLVLEVSGKGVVEQEYCQLILASGIIPIFAQYEDSDETTSIWKTFSNLYHDKKCYSISEQYLKEVLKKENVHLKQELLSGMFSSMTGSNTSAKTVRYQHKDYTLKELEKLKDPDMIKAIIYSHLQLNQQTSSAPSTLPSKKEILPVTNILRRFSSIFPFSEKDAQLTPSHEVPSDIPRKEDTSVTSSSSLAPAVTLTLPRSGKK